MKRVLIILPAGFEIFEGAAFIDVLGWANEYGNVPLEIVTAGLTEKIRPTFGGFRLIPDKLLSKIDTADFDAVAIPGGFETAGFYDEAYSESVLQTLRDFNQAHKPVVSVCVGALPVAKSRVLEGRRATTYNIECDHRTRQLAELGAEVIPDRIVEDDNVITSTCPATAVDVALMLVEKLTTKDNADQIRHLMGFRPS